MSKITTREMFIAVKEWGSISAAARALGTKRYNIANRKRSYQDEWEALEKEFNAGEIKVKKRNPNESYNAAKSNYGRSLAGQTHSIENAKKTHVPKLKPYKPSKAPEKPKKTEEAPMMNTEEKVVEHPKKEWSEERDKDMFERGYQSAKTEYDKSLKKMAEEMEKLTEENAKLKSNPKDGSNSISAREANELHDKLAILTKERNEWKGRATAHQKDLERLLKTDSEKSDRIRTLETELKEANETKDAFNHEIDKIESQLINAEAASSDEEVDFYKSTAQLYFKQWKEGVQS